MVVKMGDMHCSTGSWPLLKSGFGLRVLKMCDLGRRQSDRLL